MAGRRVADRTAEALRNARLRLVDWRFLLPSPLPARVICRARGTLAEAVAGIAGTVVETSGSGDCDLAVAEAPDPATLRELWASLAPGGVCYAEWPGNATARVEAALRSAGFEDVACYHPWPRSARLPVFWIPAGSPGAASYVRSRARLRGGRLRRLASEMAATMWGLLRGRPVGRICTLARRPVNGGRAPSAPFDWLTDHWETWKLGTRPDGISPLLITGGPRTVSKVVVLAFARGSTVPALALKAPRVSEAAAGVRREASALAHLGARGTPGVPRLLAEREVDGVPLVVESAVPGRPLETLLRPRNLAAWSARVTDWLAALGSGGTTHPRLHWREAIIEPALARFEAAFGSVVDPTLRREGAALVRAIGDLPAVPEQRDFGPWNLFVTPAGELAVLDWESAEVEGLPALDLLYYLAYAAFSVDRAWDRQSRIVSFQRSLDPSTPTGSVRRRCLAKYGEGLRLEPGELAPLRVLAWLIHAHSDFRHAEADAGGAPSAEALRRSLFVALWAAEVRHLTAR